MRVYGLFRIRREGELLDEGNDFPHPLPLSRKRERGDSLWNVILISEHGQTKRADTGICPYTLSWNMVFSIFNFQLSSNPMLLFICRPILFEVNERLE